MPGRLYPLRDPGAPRWKLCAKNLRDHHVSHHPNEEKILIQPETHPSSSHPFVTGYMFSGKLVGVGRAYDKPVDMSPKPISQVALWAMEQPFGAAPTYEQISCMDGFIAEGKENLGKIFWEERDGEIDRILIKTKEGFTLTLIGTNIVEAAIYLPRIYRSLLRRLENGEIPEGIESVEVEVEGHAEEYALAASPLRIKFKLPNPSNVSPYDLDMVVEQKLDRVLAKKTVLHIVP